MAQCGPPACAPPHTVSTFLTGLNHPWDAAFAPDGEFLFTERVGNVGVHRDGQVTRFNRPPDVVAQSEGGMLGLAIDPAFATNRRIYTCYMTVDDVRVVRWTVSGDWRTLGERFDVITDIPRTSGRHSGCRPRFGPDGYLWVTTGDAASPVNPQNGQSLAGKVLRVNTDGQAPADNAGFEWPQIYAYGLRNPQGIAFRPGDGRPYIVEHGPVCEDEVTPLVVRGNGGWDPVASGRPGVYNEAVPMTDLAKFPGAMQPVWSSGCPTIAPSGGTFLTNPRWGDHVGQMALSVLKDQQLRLVDVSDGVEDAGRAIVTGHGRLRQAVEGPDGSLYVLVDANPGSVLVVTPQG
jgi:glucose/arabinose dehydrogenase